MNTTPQLYLASASPRRHQLLTQLGFNVVNIACKIDETPFINEEPASYVMRMAMEKNSAARVEWQTNHDTQLLLPIITADTSVVLNKMILGKPKDRSQAKQMLKLLSGKIHFVLTAVTIYYQNQCESILQTNTVQFKQLSSAEIDAYVASDEPMDKAGAYGIQGLGAVFIAHLSGSYSGVMGMPLFEVSELLSKFGIKVLDK